MKRVLCDAIGSLGAVALGLVLMANSTAFGWSGGSGGAPAQKACLDSGCEKKYSGEGQIADCQPFFINRDKCVKNPNYNGNVSCQCAFEALSMGALDCICPNS